MKIICLHQSPDLYGSDRSFLQVIKYLKQDPSITLITVILPRTGPLADELTRVGAEVMYMPLSILSKTLLKQFKFGKIFSPLFAFWKKKQLFEQYDLLYVNTSVILDFYVMAPFLNMRKIIHIREIPMPTLSKVLSFFLSFSKSKIIYNSEATKASFAPLKDTVVIYNAFEGFPQLNAQVESTSDRLKILLIGRINNWKGQDFAVETLAELKDYPFTLRIVGSTFEGNEDIYTALAAQVKNLGLENNVEFVDFMDDPMMAYSWSDIVIVPSKKPEPFGRIAIEAMSIGKPVIAAAHGGLTEIVVDGSTGFLFEPNNHASFKECLLKYLKDSSLIKKHKENALKVFNEKFSLPGFYTSLDKVFKNF